MNKKESICVLGYIKINTSRHEESHDFIVKTKRNAFWLYRMNGGTPSPEGVGEAVVTLSYENGILDEITLLINNDGKSEWYIDKRKRISKRTLFDILLTGGSNVHTG